MSQEQYEPNSWNAMFSSVLSRLDNQDVTSGIYRAEVKEALTEIKALLLLQNGRVKKLESWRDAVTAKVAVIAMVASALVSFVGWLIPLLLKK